MLKPTSGPRPRLQAASWPRELSINLSWEQAHWLLGVRVCLQVWSVLPGWMLHWPVHSAGPKRRQRGTQTHPGGLKGATATQTLQCQSQRGAANSRGIVRRGVLQTDGVWVWEDQLSQLHRTSCEGPAPKPGEDKGSHCFKGHN